MSKTATVIARLDPDLKERAEAILDQLGVPASLVINMLYKQIVMTKSIPFKISLSETGEFYLDGKDGRE